MRRWCGQDRRWRCPSSKLKGSIAQVLKDEGYIEDFAVKPNDGKPELEIA